MYHNSAPETIQALFASISANYDRANTAFSFGLHKNWNKKLINSFKGKNLLLDLCAGTGEIALGFLKNYPTSEAILLDFCAEMLAVAQDKGRDLKERFEILQADAQSIPLPNNSVDAVSIAYGIRNVKNPQTCFQEVFRVLSPGGHFGILELTRPEALFPKIGHRLYTHGLLPFLGKLFTKNREAYAYLSNSVASFTPPESLMRLLEDIGFKKVSRQSLAFGAATLILSHK